MVSRLLRPRSLVRILYLVYTCTLYSYTRAGFLKLFMADKDSSQVQSLLITRRCRLKLTGVFSPRDEFEIPNLTQITPEQRQGSLYDSVQLYIYREPSPPERQTKIDFKKSFKLLQYL